MIIEVDALSRIEETRKQVGKIEEASGEVWTLCEDIEDETNSSTNTLYEDNPELYRFIDRHLEKIRAVQEKLSSHLREVEFSLDIFEGREQGLEGYISDLSEAFRAETGIHPRLRKAIQRVIEAWKSG